MRRIIPKQTFVELAEMLKKGLNYSQIARALKIDRKTVIKYSYLGGVDNSVLQERNNNDTVEK